MRFYLGHLRLLLFSSLLSCWCCGQTAAPIALGPCLIQYTSSQATDVSASHLVAYNSNSTYVEISSSFAGPTGSGTLPPSSGTFTYAIDPQNPDHATIVYKSQTGTLANDDLYFVDSDSGSQLPLGGATALGPNEAFRLYRSQETNGGSNLSNLCHLAPAESMTAGFVVQSEGPRWVLIRAVGASLGQFGVATPATAPVFTLFDSTQKVVGTSAIWSTDPNLSGGYQTIFSLVGAFQLTNGSNDSVLLMALQPGAYTSAVSAGGAGTVLCEVYFLPF